MVATITFTNENIQGFDVSESFIEELKSRKVSASQFRTPKYLVIQWSGTMQELAGKLAFADVISVDDQQRTVKVKLAEIQSESPQ